MSMLFLKLSKHKFRWPRPLPWTTRTTGNYWTYLALRLGVVRWKRGLQSPFAGTIMATLPPFSPRVALSKQTSKRLMLRQLCQWWGQMGLRTKKVKAVPSVERPAKLRGLWHQAIWLPAGHRSKLAIMEVLRLRSMLPSAARSTSLHLLVRNQLCKAATRC